MKMLRFFGLVALVSAVAGCAVAPPVRTPDPLPVPASFTAAADSGSVARLEWRSFFSDPHLVALIDSALVRNPDRLMALQRVQVAAAFVRVARGAFLPSVGVNVAVGQRRFGDFTMDGVGNFDTNFSTNIPEEKRIPEHLPDYYVGLQSAWEIDVWGKLRNQKRSAQAQLLSTEMGKNLVTTLLIAEVAGSYYELLARDTELLILQRNQQLQEAALILIQAQKEAGRATELAVKQAEAQLLNTKALEALMRQSIVAEENRLNFLLGRFPQPIPRAPSLMTQPMPQQLTAGVPAEMLTRRPDIRQAEFDLAAARFDVRAARAAFLPAVSISTAVGLQSFRPEVLWQPGSLAYGVFAGLMAPVFQRHQLKADYQRLSATQQALFQAYQKSILMGFQEVATRLNQIENLQQAGEFKQQEVTTLLQGVSNARDLYIAGLASYLEVITAQRSVLEAEIQLTEIRKDQLKAAVDLYRALGGGW